MNNSSRLGAGELASFRRRLAAALYRLCPAWLAHERDDLLQTAWVRLFEQVERADVTVNSTYLWRIAHSVIVDEIRRRRVRAEDALPSGEFPETPDARPGPQRRIEARELGRHLRDCLAGLIDDRRHAVQLRLAGFETSEIAALLARQSKQVANLVFRGMEQLRECLRAKGVHE